MKAYTETELSDLATAAYMRGFEDGRNRRDTGPTPPALEELVKHPLTSSNHPSCYRKRPWLDGVGP